LQSVIAARVLVALALAVSSGHLPGCGFTHENFEKIQNGMTVEQVSTILADPPGIYATIPFRPCIDLREWTRECRPPVQFDERPATTWLNDEVLIKVVFVDGGVQNKGWYVSEYGWEQIRHPSLWTRLRDSVIRWKSQLCMCTTN
jgi:hypothetical protein